MKRFIYNFYGLFVILFSMIGIFFIFSTLMAQDAKYNLNKPFRTKDKFTISLPTAWRDIPNEILVQASEVAKQKYRMSSFPKYDYGFQLESAIEWFAYPYILIQVKEGRIPQSEFENTTKIKKNLKKAIEEFEEKNYSIISTIKTGEPIFDPGSNTLLVQNESQIENVGMVKEVTGVILTEIGVITLHCYSLSDNYDNHFPLFVKIINSIKLSDDIKYKKRFLDNYPILQNIDWSKIIAAVIIGILLTVYYSYRKRQRSNFLK